MNALRASGPPISPSTNPASFEPVRKDAADSGQPASLRKTLPFVWQQGERLTALSLFAVGAFMCQVAVGYDLYPDGQPGPGLFPALISAALALLSAIWLLASFRKGYSGSGSSSVLEQQEEPAPVDSGLTEESADSGAGAGGTEKRVIAFTFIWTLVPLTLLDTIGFVLVMTVYVGGLLLFIAKARAWVCLPVTAVASMAAGAGLDALGIILPDPLNLLSLLGV